MRAGEAGAKSDMGIPISRLSHTCYPGERTFVGKPRIEQAHQRSLAMTERQKDAWAGALLALLMVAILLGGLGVLRLTGN